MMRVRRLAWSLFAASALFAVLASCVGDDPVTAGEGGLGGRCFPNGTCNVGLACEKGICQAADGGVGAEGGNAGDAAGDVGVPCTEDGGLEHDGHCYFVIGPAGYATAKTQCEAAGAHLVTVTTNPEHVFLAQLAAVDDWIGLRAPTPTKDAAAFTWITGEAVTVTKWNPGEPSGNGECVALVNGTGWQDRPCTDGYLAICERP